MRNLSRAHICWRQRQTELFSLGLEPRRVRCKPILNLELAGVFSHWFYYYNAEVPKINCLQVRNLMHEVKQPFASYLAVNFTFIKLASLAI